MHGMESSRNAELDEPGAHWRISSQSGQLILGAGSDDLAGAVVVGCRQAMRCEPAEHILRVTADDGRHGGWHSGARLCHGTATLAYQNHRLLGREHTNTCCRGDFTDRVTRDDTDQRVSVGWVRKQFQCSQQASCNEEW